LAKILGSFVDLANKHEISDYDKILENLLNLLEAIPEIGIDKTYLSEVYIALQSSSAQNYYDASRLGLYLSPKLADFDGRLSKSRGKHLGLLKTIAGAVRFTKKSGDGEIQKILEQKKRLEAQGGGLSIFRDSYNNTNLVDFGEFIGASAYLMDAGKDIAITHGAFKFRDYASDQLMAVLVNGYPVKTPKEMDVNDEAEARLATQFAIYEVAARTGESQKCTEQFRVENLALRKDLESGRTSAALSLDRVKAAAKELVNYAENSPYTDVPTMTVDNAKVAFHALDDSRAMIGPYSISISGIKYGIVDQTAPFQVHILPKNGDKKIRSFSGSGIFSSSIENVYLSDDEGNKLTGKIPFGVEFYVNIPRSLPAQSLSLNFVTHMLRPCATIYDSSFENSSDLIKINYEPIEIDSGCTINWSR